MVLTDEGIKIKENFISKAKQISQTPHLDTNKITGVLNQGKNLEMLGVILSSPDLNDH